MSMCVYMCVCYTSLGKQFSKMSTRGMRSLFKGQYVLKITNLCKKASVQSLFKNGVNTESSINHHLSLSLNLKETTMAHFDIA